MAADHRPLAGIRVLDAGTFVAAPYCRAVLGEFGAEVIKVERFGDEFLENPDVGRRFLGR